MLLLLKTLLYRITLLPKYLGRLSKSIQILAYFTVHGFLEKRKLFCTMITSL
jgi:hypothetical protein